MFGKSTPTTTTSSTGDNNIDGLLGGTQWQSTTVTFGFTNSFSNDYESGYIDGVEHSSNFQSLNTTQRTATYSWFTIYEDVSNLNFVELTGSNDRNGTIRLAESSVPPTAFAYYPNNTVEGGDVWFNPNDYNDPILGSYAFHTFGHEIGHALGLKHGHEIDGVAGVPLNADRDSMEFSIMTYRSYINSPIDGYSNSEWDYAQSLMMYDIRAIQEMYGADFTTNSDDTTYSFSTYTGEMFINGVGQGTPGGNVIFRTIWDGNGIDTYDFSNYTTNLEIDLTPGGWSNLDSDGNFQRANLGDGNYARGHVFNALQYNEDTRSLIENAFGGTGNDLIIGNDTGNILIGGAGNDTLTGNGGHDYMDGGDGYDTVDYTYWNGGGTYNLATGVASFPGFYDEYILDFEAILTGDGDDYIIGNSLDNVIVSGAGDDTITGNGGDDYMDGGDGNDTVDYAYWNGGGTYDLGTGTASFSGFYDEDILNFENIVTGDGNDYISGSSVDNTIVAGAGDDTLNGFDFGFEEYDTLTGGAGADVFVLGDAWGSFYEGYGFATITDFDWFEGDTFQVFGSASDYSLSTYSGGIDIYYQGDLIAYVENTTNVIIPNDFTFV